MFMPDLAHDGSLAGVLGEPVKHALVMHQLPDGSMASRLQHWLQSSRHEPVAILRSHHGDHWLPEQPAMAQIGLSMSRTGHQPEKHPKRTEQYIIPNSCRGFKVHLQVHLL